MIVILYISMKHNDPVEAYKKFKGTFIAQVGVQAIFLLIVFLSSTILQSFFISCIVGIGLLLYDYNKRFKNKKQVATELSKIFGLILLTFIINTLFYKYYNTKL